MTHTDHEPRTGTARHASVESPQDRRGSCRYPVDGLPALLGWWEAEDEPATDHRPTPERDPAGFAPATRSEIYQAVMARGPAFRKGARVFRDRAAEARHEAARPAANQSLRSCPARLVDISQTGISLDSAVVPLPDQRLWVRLDGARSTEWVEVVLRGASPRESGESLLRLAFRESCPYDFFKSAVYGNART